MPRLSPIAVEDSGFTFCGGLISNIASSMTLNELFEHYVNMQTRRKKVKIRTAQNYAGIWNKNMRQLPMANMPIGKICRTHILDTYQAMQENGAGNGSIILLHKVLNAMFNYAESSWYYNLFVFSLKQGADVEKESDLPGQMWIFISGSSRLTISLYMSWMKMVNFVSKP